MPNLYQMTRERLASYRPVSWESLPDLGLYMDQVITYIERQLDGFRGEYGEKALTPAMVNNYVKAGLIPRPVGKKYSREHLAMLLMVVQLKRACPIEQIARLFELQFHRRSVQALYAEFCELTRESISGATQALTLETPSVSPLDHTLRMAVEAGTLCHVVQTLLSGADMVADSQPEEGLE